MSGSDYILSTVTVPSSTRALTALATVKDDWGIATAADDAFLTRAINRCSAAVENFCNRSFGLASYQSVIRLEQGYRDGYLISGRQSPITLPQWPLILTQSITETDSNGASSPLAEGDDFEADRVSGRLFRLDYHRRPRDWSPTVKITASYSAGYSLPLDAWAPAAAYDVNAVIRTNGNVYQASVAGTSASAGSGPTGTGASITDGSVTWKYISAYAPTLPLDIEDAVGRLVWARYAERRRNPFIKAETVDGVGSVQYIVGNPNGGSDGGNMPSDVADILNNYRQPVVA